MDKCTTHNIPLDELNAAVVSDINSMLVDYQMNSDTFRENLICKITTNLPDVGQIKFELSELEKMLERETKKYSRLYDDYYDGVIKNVMLFERMSTECNNRIESYTARKEKLEAELKATTAHFTGVDKFLGLMSRFTKIETLSKEILNTLIEKSKYVSEKV